MKNKSWSVVYLFWILLFAGNIQYVFAQTQPTGISLSVTLNHTDWQYNRGEKALFSIVVLRAGQPVSDVSVHYEIGPEKMPPVIVKDIVSTKKSLIVDGGTLLQPGFLRCIVTATIDGKQYRGLATAAFAADRIEAYAKVPDDFAAFWDKERAAQIKIPLDSRMTLLPERCDSLINVYEASVQNNRNGSRIYGILCVPKKPGNYPTVLKVPGAGVRPYYGDTALAHKGIITFEIGIHGVTVTQPNSFYYDLAFGPLNNYFFANLDDREAYYYNRVYLGCLRAMDLLASLPQTDTSRMAVYGGSQGGALSIVTAALDRRVKYVVALYPALSDLTGYLHQRAGGWPHMFSPTAPAFLKTPEKIKTSAYYDVVNFARIVKIPGLYSWGFNDEVCPPTTSYAAYNTIPAPKELFITKESGHWLTKEQAVRVNEWLLEKLQPHNTRN